jgi:hypothetical protein
MTLQLLTHQRGAQHHPVLPWLQRVLEGKVVGWAKTAGPDMNDVEDDTTGALTENRTSKVCLQRTRPGPGAEIRELWIQ